ncbi:DUF6585 family protein [Embleya sp. NPDC001921]
MSAYGSAAPSGLLSPEIAAAASSQQLGAHRRTFTPKRVGNALLVLMFTGVLIGMAMLVVPGLLLLWRILTHTPNFSRRQAAKRLHFFERGIVVAGEEGPTDTFRYDSVTVFADVVSQQVDGSHTGTFHTYRLSRADGSLLKLTGFYEHPEQWAGLLQQGLVETQFPIARNALARGEQLRFGQLVMDRNSVTTPKGTAMWHEIHRADVENGVLVLGKGAASSWWRMHVRRIPNFPVAFLLVRQLRRG